MQQGMLEGRSNRNTQPVQYDDELRGVSITDFKTICLVIVLCNNSQAHHILSTKSRLL
jgi:hypothetical protein